MKIVLFLALVGAVALGFAPASADAQQGKRTSSKAQRSATVTLPRMQWHHRPSHRQWNDAALLALRTHGQPLTRIVPRDIHSWCPSYPLAGEPRRAAFWVGFMSALAKYESTYKQAAVGGGGRWFGLLQIAPATARGYQCRAGSGEALKNGGENLSCAVRIMAVTVPRDGVIHGRDDQWLGVAADWGPLRSSSKRDEMARWLRAQPYCATPVLRPKKRARPHHRSPDK